MKRAVREAYAAAAAVFEEAGYECSLDYTGKHAKCVAKRGAVTHRLPLPGSPTAGCEAGAKLAANSARRWLRRFPT